MEEEATQPATQLVMDPRRLGDHASDLEDDDLADIFCILHPASMSAIKVAAHIGDETPEHTVSRASVPIKVRGEEGTVADPGTFDLAANGIVSRDIALRLSAKLKDPLAGYTFGRNAQRCDFVIKYPSPEGAKRISNIHFRIFITTNGVIMLEDQSTNGTVVEGKLLKFKDKENDSPYKYTLLQGSLISLVMTPPDEDIRFVVRIPQREGMYEDIFASNLRDYFSRMTLLRQNRDAQAIGQAPDIFAGQGANTPRSDEIPINRRPKEWRGGAKYNKTRVIGKGAFATVYMITSKYDGTTFAAKELEKRRFVKNGILDQKVDQEMRIMSSIRHPNIVQYIEHVDWEDYLYIIMDYVPEGDLGGLVAARGNLAELSAKSLATQMLSALKYLHDKGITHRDIKPDNILVQSFNPFHVKLTDFGLSKRIENDDTFMRTFCGTLLYCAPEVYSEYSSYFESPSGGRNRAVVDKKSKRYDQGVDLWSLAGVLFYTLCGSPPYPAKSGTTYQQLLHNIMTGALDVRPLQRADVSQDGIDFIKSMLHTQPQYRPTIDELENSRWLRDGSVQVSLDGSIEEVDMIGQGEQYELEQSASQLSIAEESKDSFGTSDEVDLINAIVAAQDLEIPSSFISADSNSSGDNVQLTHDSSTTNHRLFGEVNASALGSSGVIPQHQLNLPLSTSPGQFTSSNLDQTAPSFVNVGVRDYNMASNDSSQGETTPPEEYKNMPSSPTLGIVTAPSLMGAESLVGNLAMNSPSPTPPGAPSPQPYPQPPLQPVVATTQSAVTIAQPAAMTPIPDFRESMRSLRRQRDPTGDDEPLAKRTKSSRALDMEISKTVFWDARDRSTHHLNYPVMTTSEYQEAKALAALAGEEFKHGGSVFETIVGPYTRSTSATPEPPSRAQSEPTSGGPAQLNRDERGLSESRNVVQTGSWINGVPSAEICQYLPEFSKSSNGAPKPVPKPVLDNGGFQVPDRILAKLIGTPDSVLPNITLNATSILTTWGRGAENKLRHADLKDTRVPKYGIKLILWQPGVKPCSGPPTDKNNTHAFYIATKASQGIKVNGVIIPSHDCRLPQKPSIYWGKLQHGDIVDVWTQDSNATQFVRFRFECFWGESKEPRKEGQFFALMGPGTLRDELDRFCEWEESAFCQAKYASELKAMSERENHNQKGWAA